MIKILHVVASLGSGGVEAFIYNYYINMDRDKIKFDFVVHGEENGIFEKKFKDLGSNIFHVTHRRKNPFKNVLEISQIIKNNNYDIVHVHIERLAFIPLYFAKKKLVRTRITHAHLSNQPRPNLVKRIYRYLFGCISNYYATHFFACSKDAALELFGEIITTKKSNIIKNAINTEKFAFDVNKRIAMRKEIGIDNSFVLGHIGRFIEQKNHSFLVDIFHEIKKRNSKAKLILVGEGPLKDSIEEKLITLGLENDVIFLGVRNDVSDLMNAFDVFVFPSIFEGLGIVLIEAQTNSLPCITSDIVVPREAEITKNINYISLQDSAKSWAIEVERITKNHKRKNEIDVIKKSGYDICQEAKKLQKFYIDSGRKTMVQFDNNKTRIIEFIGVPGVGKTTISNELINRLEFHGFKIANYSNLRGDINSPRRKRILKKIVLLFKHLGLVGWIFSFKPIQFRYRIAHLLDVLWIESELNSELFDSYDFIIVDQGVTQAISAILDLNKLNKNVSLENFYYNAYMSGNYITIHCKNSIDTSLMRLKKRTKIGNNGKLDKLNDKGTMLELYESIEHNLIVLLSMQEKCVTKCIELDTDNDVDKNIIKIMNKIDTQREIMCGK